MLPVCRAPPQGLSCSISVSLQPSTRAPCLWPPVTERGTEAQRGDVFCLLGAQLCHPPKRYIETLPSRTSEQDAVWKQESCRRNRLRCGDAGVGRVLNPIRLVSSWKDSVKTEG